MTHRARSICGVLPAAFALFLAFGCAKSSAPTAPLSKLDTNAAVLDAGNLFDRLGNRPQPFSNGWQDFFPLDSGSVWTYSIELKTTFVEPVEPTPPQIVLGSGITRMLGKVGDTYTLSIESTTLGTENYEQAVFYRQDASGLYEGEFVRAAGGAARATSSAAVATSRPIALIAASRPAAETAALRRAGAALERKIALVDAALHGAAAPAAAAGLSGTTVKGPFELQRLAYPLRIGQRWLVREDPLIVMWVEGRDGIDVEGRRLYAWRIRLEWPGVFETTDRVWFWYSSEGLLRFRYHLTGEATDDLGNPIGQIVQDWNKEIETLDVVRGTPPSF